MLSIIIPTLNAADGLPSTLNALMPGVIDGLIKELVIIDGGSDDATKLMADEAGANIFTSDPGRGVQLQTGGQKARGQWLLFLHADTVLQDGWGEEVRHFIQDGDGARAAVFRFALDDKRFRARILETIVWLRCRLLGLPYGDQGLLISKLAYDEIGGFKPIVLMEDVDMIKRIGRDRLHYFKTTALTSAARYKKDGYIKRMARNARCLTMWFAGVDPEKILEKYK